MREIDYERYSRAMRELHFLLERETDIDKSIRLHSVRNLFCQQHSELIKLRDLSQVNREQPT